MELEILERSFHLSALLSDQKNENFADLLCFIEEFSLKHHEETHKLPHHINVIDELHAGENAHSRIFAQLLRYKTGNEFPFLHHFLNEICGFNLCLKNPTIERVDSCGRIDIPIFDENFMVVIENKVTDKAPDQNTEEGGQLARYIDTINNNYGRNLEEIFVVYTPKYTREPSEGCWVRKDGVTYKEDFKSRFKSVSYRDHIYPWLKDKILPFEEKDIYLQSAIAQYIDHLEGLFSLRTINKAMNMRLQEFLKEKLNLQDKSPEEALIILDHKKEDLDNAIAQIQILKTEYLKQRVVDQFNQWRSLLRIDFPMLKIEGDNFKIKSDIINLGVIIQYDSKKYFVAIECNDFSTERFYYGLSSQFTKSELSKIPNEFQILFDNEKFKETDDCWYRWRDTSMESCYHDIKNLIEQITQLKP